MGHILVKENNNHPTTNSAVSMSMFDWQYELQKKLQQQKNEIMTQHQ